MISDEKFYDSEDSDDEEDDDDEENSEEDDDEEREKKKKKKKKEKKKVYSMDPDHRLLLRVTKPLLQSRNAAVSKQESERDRWRNIDCFVYFSSGCHGSCPAVSSHSPT